VVDQRFGLNRLQLGVLPRTTNLSVTTIKTELGELVGRSVADQVPTGGESGLFESRDVLDIRTRGPHRRDQNKTRGRRDDGVVIKTSHDVFLLSRRSCAELNNSLH